MFNNKMSKNKKSKKISKLQKISNNITETQKQKNSLMVELTFVQGNYHEIENIRNKLEILQRKILNLNDQYLQELSRCMKCTFYSVYDKTDINEISQENDVLEI